jgi:hypothetical protein
LGGTFSLVDQEHDSDKKDAEHGKEEREFNQPAAPLTLDKRSPGALALAADPFLVTLGGLLPKTVSALAAAITLKALNRMEKTEGRLAF